MLRRSAKTSNYYKSAFGTGNRKKSRKRGKSVWMLILDIFMLLLTVSLAAVTIAIAAVQYFDPSRLWVLPVLALGAPIIYILDIAVTLYWIIRWKWRHVIFAAVFVVLGTAYLHRYYKIDITRDYGTEYVERHFTKVITYNVANGDDSRLVEYVREKNPDIVCLQEFLTEPDNKWKALGDKYKSTVDGTSDFSCEIFTKYRILKSGEIDSLPRYNGIWADLKIGDDTLRVINVHLQSTSRSTEDTQFIQHHEYIYDNERNNKFRNIVSKLADNNCKRAVQSRHIRSFIEASPYRVLVCGDFNDVPMSYTYRCMSEGLTDAFCDAGRGYSYTFDGYFKLLRIDYMLVDPDVEVISYEVDNGAEYSDHYPVMTRLKFNKQ